MGRKNPKTELLHGYLSAAGFAVVRIWKKNSGNSCLIDLAPDKGPELPAPADADSFWFAKVAHAEMAMGAACAALGTSPCETTCLSATDARDALINAAAALGAGWRTTDEVLAIAEKAVAEVERHINALNASGGLKQINGAYKKYRLAMQATAEKAMSYSEYFQSYKVRIVRIVGENAAAGGDLFGTVKIAAPETSTAIARKTAGPHAQREPRDKNHRLTTS